MEYTAKIDPKLAFRRQFCRLGITTLVHLDGSFFELKS